MKHHIGHIVNYFLGNQYIILYFNNGKSLIVYFDENTGRPVKRKKGNTLTGVFHTGLWLGTIEDGTGIIAHNHYLVGRPSIATMKQFGQREKVYWCDRNCSIPQNQRVQIALEQILKRKQYHVLNYNCQHFVNICSSRQIKSESVENAKVGLGMFAGVLVIAMLLGK